MSLTPDFSNLDEALDFILEVVNDPLTNGDLRQKRRRVLDWLTEYPSLLIVDDIDSVATDSGEAGAFFTDEVLRTRSKVLFTSRRDLFGMEARQTPVRGLDGEKAADTSRLKPRSSGSQSIDSTLKTCLTS